MIIKTINLMKAIIIMIIKKLKIKTIVRMKVLVMNLYLIILFLKCLKILHNFMKNIKKIIVYYHRYKIRVKVADNFKKGEIALLP